MIDRIVIASSVIYLFLHIVSSAPTNVGVSLASVEASSSSISQNSSDPLPTDISTVPSISELSIPAQNQTSTSLEHTVHDKEQLQASPSFRTTPKSRKNQKDVYFCCPEDDLEHATESSRKNKDRERNTKPPIVRRGKDPEEEFEEPTFVRRPALLLRFFPDGTAVLISKFQLHLHVKPKQINFEPDEKEEHLPVEIRPGLILNDGKSYEVSYKRLEALPLAREQNVFDLDESEENEAYNEDINHRDHEFVTPSGAKSLSASSKPHPLQESTITTSVAEAELPTNIPTVDKNRFNTNQSFETTVGESPFFVSGGVSSPKHPSQAEPLKETTVTESSPTISSPRTPDSSETRSTPISSSPSPSSSTVATTQSTTLSTEASPTVEPLASTPKCISFKNQLSLALSTEDNIGNSLLKKNILPTEDCKNPETEKLNSIANIQLAETTTRPPPTTLPIITRPTTEPTTPSYTRNNLVPYLASKFSNDPSKPDVVVVTSLPVLIDLKSTRNQPVTDVPAWKEVTVGVVRDQQGQPLKPRYNNWTSHLRGLRKKTDNKFWNDLTTPKPVFGPHSRQPIQQGFLQAPSQINRSFWADLQRQRPLTDQRSKSSANSQLYRSNPPRNYPVQNKNEYRFWRHDIQNSGWAGNTNRDDERQGPPRSSHRSFENQENHSNQHWNRGNTLKNHRRW